MGINPRPPPGSAALQGAAALALTRIGRTPSLADTQQSGARLLVFPQGAPGRASWNPMAIPFPRRSARGLPAGLALGAHGLRSRSGQRLHRCEAATSPA